MKNTKDFFSTSKLEDQTFNSKDFSKLSLVKYSFIHCFFNRCNFTESSWNNALFISCTFKNCNLSLIKLDCCRLQDVLFIECKIIGADFFKCDVSFIFSIKIEKSFLQYCNFSILEMKDFVFKGSKIHNCTFIGTCLVGSNFTDTDLKDTTFHTCDLSKANFCGAINYIIVPQVNKIKKAKFSFPEVVGLLKGYDITIVYN